MWTPDLISQLIVSSPSSLAELASASASLPVNPTLSNNQSTAAVVYYLLQEAALGSQLSAMQNKSMLPSKMQCDVLMSKVLNHLFKCHAMSRVHQGAHLMAVDQLRSGWRRWRLHRLQLRDLRLVDRRRGRAASWLAGLSHFLLDGCRHLEWLRRDVPAGRSLKVQLGGGRENCGETFGGKNQ